MRERASKNREWAPWYFRTIGEARARSRSESSPCGGAGKSVEENPVPWELVHSHLFFVVKLAREFRYRGMPLEDLVSEGNLGLMEAARRFDPTRGVRFSSWAVWWIRKAILLALYRHSSLVRVPEYLFREVCAVERTGAALSRRLGQKAGPEEISREIGIQSREAERGLPIRFREVPLDDGDESSKRPALSDRLADLPSRGPEQRILLKEKGQHLRRLLLRLSAREREVMTCRFGLEGEETLSLQETGMRLGISREPVRQIEVQSKQRLRRMMAREGFRHAEPKACDARGGGTLLFPPEPL